MKSAIRHEQKMARHHLGEMLGTFLLYVLVQTASLIWGPSLPDGLARTLGLLCPALPAFLMLGAVIRHFRRIDEYLRVQMLENIAIMAAVLFGGTFLYGLLEGVGLPRLSMVIICPVMATVSAAVSILRRVFNQAT